MYFIAKFKTILLAVLLVFSCSILSGCSSGVSEAKNYKKLSKEDPRNTKYKGHYKVGKEYTIKGETYKPKEVKRYSSTGVASWYGSKNGFHGKKTANGDVYNKNLLTAAHRTMSLPSLVEVKNLENGKTLIVMVNDRGPYSHKREIDVSEKAADILGFKNKGTAKVKVQYLHQETQEFLKKLGLKTKEGSLSSTKLANSKCSVNCHIKLVNLKHGHNHARL
jgi:rare lipoprotein A